MPGQLINATGVRLFILGAWAGLILGLGLAARAAFGALPVGDAATAVGEALPQIEWLGVGLGLAATALGLRRPSSTAARIQALLPLLGVGLHLLSLLWIDPAVREIRAEAGGSMQGLAAPDPRLLQFGRLHAVSMGVFASCLLVPIASAFWDLCEGRRRTGD